jgi:hypothetical protein
MLLNEFFHKEPSAYQDLSQDNSQPQESDLRKTRLTLRQLNKLRKMNDVRMYEFKEKLKLVKKQYAPPPARQCNKLVIYWPFRHLKPGVFLLHRK